VEDPFRRGVEEKYLLILVCNNHGITNAVQNQCQYVRPLPQLCLGSIAPVYFPPEAIVDSAGSGHDA